MRFKANILTWRTVLSYADTYDDRKKGIGMKVDEHM